jgi:tellurite resistance protein TerC
LALLTIEGLDILFALDSIPAIFGVTTNTMIIYTSNAFAVLGLRSLYFVVMEYSSRLQIFKRTIGLILSFIGLKILISPMYSISVGVSLGVIVGLILATVLASFVLKKAK